MHIKSKQELKLNQRHGVIQIKDMLNKMKNGIYSNNHLPIHAKQL